MTYKSINNFGLNDSKNTKAVCNVCLVDVNVNIDLESGSDSDSDNENENETTILNNVEFGYANSKCTQAVVQACKCVNPYVHIACLDKIRCSENILDFLICSKCNFTYRLKIDEDVDHNRRRKVRHYCALVRDNIMFFTIAYLIIFLTKLFIADLDTDLNFYNFFPNQIQASVNCVYYSFSAVILFVFGILSFGGCIYFYKDKFSYDYLIEFYYELFTTIFISLFTLFVIETHLALLYMIYKLGSWNNIRSEYLYKLKLTSKYKVVNIDL